MRTLRLSLAGMVIMVVLGGLAGAVLARSDDTGGAVTIESTEILSQGVDESGRFMVVSMAKEASDPRLSGTWTEVWNCQEGPDYGVCVGSVRVANEGGTWLGRVGGFGFPGSSADWTVLEGQGDYGGLTAIRHSSESSGDKVEEGVVFDFEMPAMPEPAEPPDE